MDLDLEGKARFDHMAVKEAVLPFTRFANVDTILGPEMKSTGGVMGLDKKFPLAFAKSQIGAGNCLPTEGRVFISVEDRHDEEAVEIAGRLQVFGFQLIATRGAQRFMVARGLRVESIDMVLRGQPHCVDAILNGEVQLVINTTDGAQAISDSFSIQRTAVTNNVPHYTTMTGAVAAVDGIEALSVAGLEVAPLQAYFKRSF